MKNEGMHEIKGKGWYFSTNIIGNDGLVHRVYGQWFSTKNECRAAMIQKKAEVIEQSNAPTGDIDFVKFFKEFEEYCLNTSVCISTLRNKYDEVYKCYFIPFFANKTVKEVFEIRNVALWYDRLCSMDKSTDRKNNVVYVFKKMARYAYDSLYIDPKSFQLADVRVRRFREENKPSKEVVAWTDDECKRFLDSIPEGSKDYVMFSLFLSTAPRIGEFLALTPNDFDRRKKTITINKQLASEGSDVVLRNRLKTKNSYRIIPITDSVCSMLSKYIDDFGIKGDEFIFGGKSNDYMSRSNFRLRMDKYIKLSGVRHTTPHGIRHTLATKLSNASVSMADREAGSGLLGHSIDVDAKIYADHNKEENARLLIEKINKA